MNIECYHKISKDHKVKGFLDYTKCSEIEEVIRYNVYEVLEDNQVLNTSYTDKDEIDYLCIYAHGSRVYGNPRKDSDIDFVLFYKGSIREDDLFNIFADESIYIEHIKCDFNPIEINDESDIEYYIQRHDIEYNLNHFKEPLTEKMHNLALALDDLENIEDNSFISNDIIDSDDVIKNKIELKKYVVDFNLPSKTLWCKFNMGCDKRFDFDRYKYERCDGKAEWYGNYYAWGEMNGYKDKYIVSKYKFAEYSGHGIDYIMTKYGADGLNRLLPEDDVVQLKLNINNFKFHIPTKEQFEELLTYTNQEFHNDYKGYEGLNGLLLISKNDSNISMFLPAAGYYNEYSDTLYKSGLSGCYWTSDLYDVDNMNNKSYIFYFNGLKLLHEVPPQIVTEKRWEGLQIRPVLNLKG